MTIQKISIYFLSVKWLLLLSCGRQGIFANNLRKREKTRTKQKNSKTNRKKNRKLWKQQR